MLYHFWILSALCAVALAAPKIPPASPEAALLIREYFETLASEIQEVKRAEKKEPPKGTGKPGDKEAGARSGPGCDTSGAKLPSSSLPGPSGTLKFIGIGSGTQNYTCKAKDAKVVPVAIGAVASLADGTCTGAKSTKALDILPRLAMEFDIEALLGARAAGGRHFFNGGGAPVFDTPAGTLVGSKSASADSPKKGSVAWLKLTAVGGSTGGLSEVYRVNTVGGTPPANCADSATSFEVKYSAEYWFFGK